MAKIRFSDKVAEVQGQLAEGGFMDKPTIGDYMTIAAQNLATGLQAAEKERMIKEKEARAAAAAEAKRIRKEQEAEAEKQKKLTATVNAYLSYGIRGDDPNIKYDFSKIEGGKVAAAEYLRGQFSNSGLDLADFDAFANNLVSTNVAFQGAKTPVDITVNTSSQMKNLGQEEATTDNIVNRKLILGKEYRSGESNLVDFGTTKIDIFAPANLATEDTWQKAIADVRNQTYGTLRQNAEIDAIKAQALQMGWITIGDSTVKEIKNMSTDDLEGWINTQNLTKTEEAQVVAILEKKQAVEDSKAWHRQPVADIIQWYASNTNADKDLELSGMIAIEEGFSADESLTSKEREKSRKTAERLRTAQVTIQLINGKAKFDEISDLLPLLSKDLEELKKLRIIVAPLGVPNDVQQAIETFISMAKEEKAAKEQNRIAQLTGKERSLEAFRKSAAYSEGLKSGQTIKDLEAAFEADWKRATDISIKEKGWFEKEQNLLTLSLEDVNLLLDGNLIGTDHPQYNAIQNIKTLRQGATDQDDIDKIAERITQTAGQGPEALKTLLAERGMATLLNSNDDLLVQYNKQLAIAEGYKETEEIDEYQIILKTKITEIGEENFNNMDSEQLLEFFGDIKKGYDAARTVALDKNYTEANFKDDLIKYSLALKENPNDEEAKNFLDNKAPIIEAQLLRVSGLDNEAKMKAKLQNRGMEDTTENRAMISNAENIKIYRSFSGFPMRINIITGESQIITSEGSSDTEQPVSSDQLLNTLQMIETNPNEFNYLGEVNFRDDGSLLIQGRDGENITLTRQQISDGLSLDRDLEENITANLEEGIKYSQGIMSYIRQGIGLGLDTVGLLKKGTKSQQTIEAIKFLEKLKINTILKLSAAQGTRDSVWQKTALLTTLPERGLVGGNVIAATDYESVLTGLIRERDNLREIVNEAKSGEGTVQSQLVSKSSRTLKDFDTLIPLYEAVIAAFKQDTSEGTTGGQGSTGNIQDLKLEKDDFTRNPSGRNAVR